MWLRQETYTGFGEVEKNGNCIEDKEEQNVQLNGEVEWPSSTWGTHAPGWYQGLCESRQDFQILNVLMYPFLNESVWEDACDLPFLLLPLYQEKTHVSYTQKFPEGIVLGHQHLWDSQKIDK